MAARASTSSLAPVSLSTLSDPPIRHIDATAYEYFLIEMVSTLRESAAYATARSKAIEKEMADAGLIVPTPTTVTGPPQPQAAGVATPAPGTRSPPSNPRRAPNPRPQAQAATPTTQPSTPSATASSPSAPHRCQPLRTPLPPPPALHRHTRRHQVHLQGPLERTVQ
ncbi:hypothetical protein CC2G_004918 [Coprinopsis cinerea AmutBmut pab1-1]|nr:hypothetical protein CC2G_004918 [Coprinopsis cinerea AmutBmut pab1-1]